MHFQIGHDSAVSFDIVKARLAQIQAKNTLLLLDCCQNRPVGRSTSAAPMTDGEELALASLARDIQAAQRKQQTASMPTVAILNACCEGQKAYEWDSRRHGIFTAHLLDGFEKGFDSIASLASWTVDRVAKTAREVHCQNQIPFITIEGKGDISLLKTLASNASAVKTKKPPIRLSARPPKPPQPVQAEFAVQWWVLVDGQEKGPLDELAIRDLIANRKVLPDSLCWVKGMSEWQTITKTKVFTGCFLPKRTTINEVSKKYHTTPPVSPPRRKIKPPIRQKTSADWWAVFEDDEKGPFTEQQIKEFINDGKVTSNTDLWKAGDPYWKQAGEMEEWKSLVPVTKAALTDTHNLLVKSFAKRKIEAYLSLSQSIKMAIGDSYISLKKYELQNMEEDIQTEIAKSGLYLDYNEDSDQVDYSERPKMILLQNSALIKKYRENISIVHSEIRKLESKKEADYKKPYEYESAKKTLGQLYCIAGTTDKAKKCFNELLGRGTSSDLRIGLATIGYTDGNELANEIYDNCKNKLVRVYDYINCGKIAVALGVNKADVVKLLNYVETTLESDSDGVRVREIAQIWFFSFEIVDNTEKIIRQGIDRIESHIGSFLGLPTLAELSFFGLRKRELAFSVVAKMAQLAEDAFDILDMARLYKLLGDHQKSSNFYKKYHKMLAYGCLGSNSILNAEKGDPKSQNLMGALLLTGSDGCYKNEQEASEWFRKAAEQGNKDAQKTLKRLESSCFISTAVCTALNKPDNCPELTLLREFRDTYMQETPVHRAEVAEYYRIAPAIVKTINAQPNHDELWHDLAERFILPCVKLTVENNPDAAYCLYREMIVELKQKYCPVAQKAGPFVKFLGNFNNAAD